MYSGTVVVDSDGQKQTLTFTNSAFVAEHMGGVATDSEATEEQLISVDAELEVNSSQLVTSTTLRRVSCAAAWFGGKSAATRPLYGSV